MARKYLNTNLYNYFNIGVQEIDIDIYIYIDINKIPFYLYDVVFQQCFILFYFFITWEQRALRSGHFEDKVPADVTRFEKADWLKAGKNPNPVK